MGAVFGHSGSTEGNAVRGPSALPFFSRSYTRAARCEEVIDEGTGPSVPKSTTVHSKHLGGAFAVPRNVIHSSGDWGKKLEASSMFTVEGSVGEPSVHCPLLLGGKNLVLE